MNRIIFISVISGVAGALVIIFSFMAGVFVGRYMDSPHNKPLPMYEFSQSDMMSKYHVTGSIQSINNNQIVVKAGNNSVNVNLTSNTRITKGTNIVGKSALSVGQSITVLGTSQGNFEVNALRIIIES